MSSSKDERGLALRIVEYILRQTKGPWRAFEVNLIRQQKCYVRHPVIGHGTDEARTIVFDPDSLKGIEISRDLLQIQMELKRHYSEIVYGNESPVANLKEDDQIDTPFGLAIVRESDFSDGSFWYLTVDISPDESHWGSDLI